MTKGKTQKTSKNEGKKTSKNDEAKKAPKNGVKKAKGGGLKYMSENDKCVVCEDKPTGMHYHAMTCEGCKGFFRRLVQASEGKPLDLKCKKNDNCVITKMTRNSCRSCRFKKCLDKRMDMSSVKDELQREALRKVKSQNNKKKLIETYIDQIAASYKSPDFKDFFCFPLGLLKFGQMAVPSMPHLPGKGPAVMHTYNFVQNIPGIDQIDNEDLVTLIKHRMIDVVALQIAEIYDPKENVLKFLNVTIQESDTLSNEMLHRIFKYAKHYSQFCTKDGKVLGCLCAVRFLNADGLVLKDRKKVEKALEHVLEIATKLWRKQGNRLSKLFRGLSDFEYMRVDKDKLLWKISAMMEDEESLEHLGRDLSARLAASILLNLSVVPSPTSLHGASTTNTVSPPHNDSAIQSACISNNDSAIQSASTSNNDSAIQSASTSNKDSAIQSTSTSNNDSAIHSASTSNTASALNSGHTSHTASALNSGHTSHTASALNSGHTSHTASALNSGHTSHTASALNSGHTSHTASALNSGHTSHTASALNSGHTSHTASALNSAHSSQSTSPGIVSSALCPSSIPTRASRPASSDSNHADSSLNNYGTYSIKMESSGEEAKSETELINTTTSLAQVSTASCTSGTMSQQPVCSPPRPIKKEYMSGDCNQFPASLSSLTYHGPVVLSEAPAITVFPRAPGTLKTTTDHAPWPLDLSLRRVYQAYQGSPAQVTYSNIPTSQQYSSNHSQRMVAYLAMEGSGKQPFPEDDSQIIAFTTSQFKHFVENLQSQNTRGFQGQAYNGEHYIDEEERVQRSDPHHIYLERASQGSAGTGLYNSESARLVAHPEIARALTLSTRQLTYHNNPHMSPRYPFHNIPFANRNSSEQPFNAPPNMAENISPPESETFQSFRPLDDQHTIKALYPVDAYISPQGQAPSNQSTFPILPNYQYHSDFSRYNPDAPSQLPTSQGTYSSLQDDTNHLASTGYYPSASTVEDATLTVKVSASSGSSVNQHEKGIRAGKVVKASNKNVSVAAQMRNQLSVIGVKKKWLQAHLNEKTDIDAE